MLTYFLQVYDPAKDEEDNPVVWLGGRARELYELEDLLLAARPYAELLLDGIEHNGFPELERQNAA